MKHRNSEPSQFMPNLVAIIEDEKSKLSVLKRHINSLGFASIEFESLKALHVAFPNGKNFDALILTSGPGENQEELESIVSCAEVPVLLIASDDEIQRLTQLIGGLLVSEHTDILFSRDSLAELGLRLNLLIERSRKARRREESDFSWGNFEFFARDRRFVCDGREVILTPREHKLALMLFRNVGNVVSRERIVIAAWGDTVTRSRSVDVHIARIRKTLGLNRENGAVLMAVYKQGYQLTLAKKARREIVRENANQDAVR
jgi:DNA-binding response OmpR family regulator